MSDNTDRPAKLFTVDQANATLPLVRAIVSDMVTLSRDLIDRRQRLSQLSGDRDRDDPYASEVAQIEEELEKEGQRLVDYVEELRQLGVEPKAVADGLVDFPSMMDGRVVYLCWRLGESEVGHWHELDAGFRGRQSLTANSIADDGSLGGALDGSLDDSGGSYDT